MGMAAILFNSEELFKEIVNNLSTEGPMWNLVKITQALLGKKTFQNNTIIYVYSPGARADYPHGTKFWL